ncbi:MAG TPA: hypothetical protein VE263_17910 [Candidatus Angelobacter sp.]|nr:hypothetical protein [Candidatus Angelobacter sp.]
MKHPNGYTFGMGFLAVSRFKVGLQVFQDIVESKYLTVREAHLEELDKAMASAPKKLTPDPGGPHGNPPR